MKRKKQNNARKLNAQSRGIIREIVKEQGLLSVYRGRHTIHTSRAEKRRSRSGDIKKAVKDSKDED